MVRLVTELSKATGTPVPALLQAFGQYLAERFREIYPQFFARAKGTFDFLSQVDSYIHVEVRKLYPEAELPTFECSNGTEGRLTMVYRSPRGFADLAEGLMRGSAACFGEEIDIAREDLSGGAGTHVRFTLTRRGGTS